MLIITIKFFVETVNMPSVRWCSLIFILMINLGNPDFIVQI